MYDVVTLGETMLRFTPPDFQRLEQARQLEVHIGGSESNTVVGLARLGRRVAWLSRMSNNPMGHLVTNTLAQFGVDVSWVIWTNEDRVGTYYLERGASPRAAQVHYDRRDSAVSHIQPADLPSEVFQPNLAKFFHTTGITLGISGAARTTAIHAAQLAKAAGWRVSFDINYRAKLWTANEARAGCLPLCELADFIFLPQRDALQVFQLNGLSREQILNELSKINRQATFVMTLGSEGALARTPDGQFLHQAAFRTTEVERLGSGDAFTAGFLFGWLEYGELAQALRWGAATASLKYTIPGDLPIISRQEVENLLSNDGKNLSIAR